MARLTIVRRTESDVRCHRCLSSIGVLRPSAARPDGAMLLRSASDGALAIVRLPIRLTCPACAGSRTVEEPPMLPPGGRFAPAHDLPPVPA